MDDVFQDALSAVGYSEKESEEEDSSDALGFFDEENEDDVRDKVTEIPLKTPKKAVKPKKDKVSFWKRIFGNIVTEETAELEAKERAAELADEEERAKLKRPSLHRPGPPGPWQRQRLPHPPSRSRCAERR